MKVKEWNMVDIVIGRDPEILGGIPCFRGTRVPFPGTVMKNRI